MAQGLAPYATLSEMPQGLWVTPRWFGIETRPAVMLVAIEFLSIVMHTPLTLIGGTAIVLVLYGVLAKAFERDEQLVALMLKNKHYVSLAYMRGEAITSSRYEHLERIMR